MLELHNTDVPEDHRSILPFLLQPASWVQEGSIPALVRILRAFLAGDAPQMAQTGQFTVILAVVQQKLIPSRVEVRVSPERRALHPELRAEVADEEPADDAADAAADGGDGRGHV